MTKFEVDFSDDNGIRNPSESLFLLWFPELERFLKIFDVKEIKIVVTRKGKVKGDE